MYCKYTLQCYLAYPQVICENGCPWHEGTCALAAERGSLDCLQYAHERGCPWDGSTCAAAARAGSLACLQYAHENGCPWQESTCAQAAECGSLKCLQYAHKHGCSFEAGNILLKAVQGRSLPCIVYARETMGCTWHPEGTEALCAVSQGSNKTLNTFSCTISSAAAVLADCTDKLCLDVGQISHA